MSGAAPPLVAKTFLNEQHCVPTELSTRAEYTSATFQLSPPMLRSFYTQDEPRLVYYVDNLRLEDPYDIPPCNGTSRWRQRAGACVAESVIDAVVKEKLVAAIAEGSSEGGEVLDLQLQEACASGSDTSVPIAANVTVDGACWEHSHPDQLNVYDFTSWATVHPGGAAAIKQFAVRGEVALRFPSWHYMNGGQDNSRTGGWEIKHLNFVYLGRLNDVVDFQLLDPSLQSASIAELVGSEQPVYTEVFEVCGSPGEVANAPAESNRYSMLLTNDRTRPGDSYPMDVPGLPLGAAEAGLTTDDDLYRYLFSYNRDRTGTGAGASSETTSAPLGTYPLRQGKNIVWTAVALRAEDQLRQRVAWALYQVFVISDASGMKSDEAEVSKYN